MIYQSRDGNLQVHADELEKWIWLTVKEDVGPTEVVYSMSLQELCDLGQAAYQYFLARQHVGSKMEN